MNLSFLTKLLVLRLRARFYESARVKIGKKCTFEKNVSIKLTGNVSSTVVIGDRTSVCTGVQLITEGGNITIGSYCTINPYCMLYGNGGLTIGNNVRIATHTVIVAGNHIFSSRDLPICEQGISTKGIKIDDDVWIGCNCSILDGVHIKKGCVIGAGSVVTRSTEEYGVYVGNPAKLIKKR